MHVPMFTGPWPLRAQLPVQDTWLVATSSLLYAAGPRGCGELSGIQKIGRDSMHAMGPEREAHSVHFITLLHRRHPAKSPQSKSAVAAVCAAQGTSCCSTALVPTGTRLPTCHALKWPSWLRGAPLILQQPTTAHSQYPPLCTQALHAIARPLLLTEASCCVAACSAATGTA